jgi:PAS domain S-box-containing protein
LQIHQIGLLMKNEELRRTQAELAAASKRYSRFYDLAPMGFCSLNENGLILESNLTFAAWSGKARGDLPSQSFNRFILPEDQDIFSLHCRQLFETGKPQTCELRLLRQNKEPLWVTVEATIVHDPERSQLPYSAVRYHRAETGRKSTGGKRGNVPQHCPSSAYLRTRSSG